MNLMEKQLDTIMIDATTNFSGNLDIDGNYSMDIFLEALSFANPYLRKGGTVVFKTVECARTNAAFVFF